MLLMQRCEYILVFVKSYSLLSDYLGDWQAYECNTLYLLWSAGHFIQSIGYKANLQQ